MALTLFEMPESKRESLIDAHEFYFQQATRRLLAQFDNFEELADSTVNEWVKSKFPNLYPDSNIPESICVQIDDVAIEYYCLMRDMREQTALSVAASMFHQFEKGLKDWVVEQVSHWHQSASLKQAIWRADFLKLTDLLEHIGFPAIDEDYFRKIDACRLVVNTYKHGNGSSFDQLKNNFPEYIDDPLAGFVQRFEWVSDYLEHSNVKVALTDLTEFSESIIAFWRQVPENITDKDVTTFPRWFKTALKN